MNDAKKVLWNSVTSLMLKHYGKENLTRLAKDCGIGPGTSTRLKEQQTSVGLEVIEKIAKHFGYEPWQLLVPGFDPEHAPTLQPLSAREAELYRRWREVTREFIKES